MSDSRGQGDWYGYHAIAQHRRGYEVKRALPKIPEHYSLPQRS